MICAPDEETADRLRILRAHGWLRNVNPARHDLRGFDVDPRKVELLAKGESFIKHIGAERVAAACLRFRGVEQVTVTVHKPHAPIEVPFDDVELRIVRGQRGDA